MRFHERGNLDFVASCIAQAIKLDPKYAKAYYRYASCRLSIDTEWKIRFRRGTCYLQTLNQQKAIADFKKVLVLEPKNDTVKTQLQATQKLVRKLEFEKVWCFPVAGVYPLIRG